MTTNRYAPDPSPYDGYGMPKRLAGHKGPLKIRELLTNEELTHLHGLLTAKMESPFSADRFDAGQKLPKLKVIMIERGIA